MTGKNEIAKRDPKDGSLSVIQKAGRYVRREYLSKPPAVAGAIALCTLATALTAGASLPLWLVLGAGGAAGMAGGMIGKTIAGVSSPVATVAELNGYKLAGPSDKIESLILIQQTISSLTDSFNYTARGLPDALQKKIDGYVQDAAEIARDVKSFKSGYRAYELKFYREVIGSNGQYQKQQVGRVATQFGAG